MENVTVNINDGIAEVVLNRPDRGNAMDLESARQLAKAFEEVAGVQKDLRAVVVMGSGPRFCVGGDLNGFLESAQGDRLCDVLARPLHEAVLAMSALEVPVVTAVHGGVGGGGLGIMLGGDIIIAAEDTVFRCGYTGSGLSPDCGVTWHLARVMGMARAMDLILTNRRVSAQEALGLGMVSRVVAPEALNDTVQSVLDSLLAIPRETIAQTKRLMWSGWEASRRAQLDDEAITIGRVGDLDESRAAMAAFLAGRRIGA